MSGRLINRMAVGAILVAVFLLAGAARAEDASPNETGKPAATKPPKAPWNPIARARQSARRAKSMNNMRQMLLAFLISENEKGALPAAFIADKEGKPLLSWRVAILPYLDETELYDQFHLDEPWDSEHNKKLIASMPDIYNSPSGSAGEGKTNYLAVRNTKTGFVGRDGVKLDDFKDGLSNTILLVEADDEKAVEWTRPLDLEPTGKDPHAGLGGIHPEGFLSGFADGSIRVIAYRVDAKVLWALFTRSGGEEVPQSY